MNTKISTTLVFMLLLGRLCYAEDGPAPDQFKASSEVSALIAKLQSDNTSNRTYAAKALVAIGPSAAQPLVHAMVPSKETTMIDAFAGLGSDAVPMMLALIVTDQSGDLRHNPGLDGILIMGTNALPGLEEALRAPDPKTRGSVIDTLRILQGDPDPKTGCARLLFQEAKTDQDDSLRVYATDALGYSGLFGSKVPPEVRAGLHELLKDKDQKVRITAASSLAKACRESSPEVLTDLAEGLKQSNTGLAFECAFATSFLGSNAAPLLPELTKALQGGNASVATQAADVLATLGDPAFAPLSAAAADSKSIVRSCGLNALAGIAINSTNHLEASLGILANALSHPDSDTRQAALGSLCRIGVERRDPLLAQRIIVILNPLKADPDKWVRSNASDALDKLRSVSHK